MFHFEISGKCINNEQLLNRESKEVKLEIFHFEISDKFNNEELKLKLSYQ